MIQSKADLQYYLGLELKRFEASLMVKIRRWLRKEEDYYLEKYHKVLRRYEFYKNTQDYSLYRKCMFFYYSFRHCRLSEKMGLMIAPNMIGPGLTLYHTVGGKTYVNCPMGRNIILRYNVNTGSNANSTRKAEEKPVVEDYVEFSPGAKVFGKIKIGRGALIGMNSAPFQNIPPYAIVIGNPGKIIGFTKTPEEIIEFEREVYPEAERLSVDVLEMNYKKYYLDRLKEIKSFMSVK